ncbi:MAG: hypothetical protein ABI779_01210 [Acidobacteriota bacterium]
MDSTSGQQPSSTVTASQANVALHPECDEVLSDPRADVFVARVVEVMDNGATNAHPPQVTLHVEQVVNGHLPQGEMRATWQPYSAAILCAVGEEESIARWNATPLAGPKPGERLLLAGAPSESEYSVEGGCARPATPANVEQAKAGLARMRTVQAATDRAEKAIRDADRRVQASADLTALYRSADVVMVATEPSEAVGSGVSVFTFRVLRRFKDSGPEGTSATEFAYVRMSNIAHRQLTQRLSGTGRVVLFLRTVPKREWHAWEAAQQQLTNIDHRRFVPVENTVSVLHETKEIIDFLERRSK